MTGGDALAVAVAAAEGNVNIFLCQIHLYPPFLSSRSQRMLLVRTAEVSHILLYFFATCLNLPNSARLLRLGGPVLNAQKGATTVAE